MSNKQILGDLAMDLKRVALGYNRGSDSMAEKFFEEALKRRDKIDMRRIKPYLIRFLKDIENIRKENKKKVAEDALMYSTIFQNASKILEVK